MTRRRVLAALIPILGCLRAESVPGLSIRGKLDQSDDGKPALDLPGNHKIALHGDDPTMGVLNDKRLAAADLEAIGHYTTPTSFEVDPIHLKAMFVHKDNRKLLITYWCDVCYIRTYTPGVCWCCQKYTDLDLRPADQP